MKNPMKIDQMLFPDGVIEEYEFNKEELSVIFKDSSGSKWLLCFSGSIEVQERESVGLSIYRSYLDKEGGKMKLRLLDDDLKEMLTIKFLMCRIEEIDSSLTKQSTM